MKNHLILTVICFVISQSVSSTVYKVGEAWGTDKSYISLQELINAGVGKAVTDEIWIAGEQELNAQWVISTWQGKIYGGFSGIETAVEQRQTVSNGRGWEFVHPTTLKLKTRTGQNSIISSFSYASNGEIVSLIDGIRFDGSNCTASPLFIRQFSSAGLTIKNCVIENADLPTNNTMNPGTADFEAGAINLGSDDAVNVRNVVVEECLVQSNKARIGAIMARNATILNCVIINNIGVDSGHSGGLFARTELTLANTIFWNNKIGSIVNNVNANGQILAASSNIIDLLTPPFTAENGNIMETDSTAIFSPKTIIVNNLQNAEILPKLPASVVAGKTVVFKVSSYADKITTIKVNDVKIHPNTEGLYRLVAMQNCVVDIVLEDIEPYIPTKASTATIDWETFLAQHDMYWTSLSADPVGKSDDNNLKTGYYAGALMGNGLIGTNMYKLNDNVYRLNAARSDITEVRRPYNLYNSARLPVGYFTLATVGKVTDEKMRLSLYDAMTKGRFTTDKGRINFKTYVHADKNYIVFETDADGDEADYTWSFVAQQAISPRQIRNNDAPTGYLNSEGKSNPDAETRLDGDYHLTIQKLVTDNTFSTVARVYVVAWKEVKTMGHRRIVATIAQESTETAAIASAKVTLDEAFAQTEEVVETTHKEWWNKFYQNAAFVSFPNTKFESFYWAQYYKFASCTRPGKPLVDLQGVWPSWDTPWTAIWVNLNLQLTYSWQTKSNLGMLSESLWDALNNNLLNLHRNTSLMSAKYGGGNVDGYWDDAAVLPRTATYDLYAPLDPAGADRNQYEVGNLAWTLFYYWQHCVGYGDTEALTTKLFPLLKDAINTFFHIRTTTNGKYGIPVTASPEYTSGSAGANTNYDLANLRWGLMTLIDIDTTYHINDPKLAEWKDFLDNLVDFQTDANGYKISSTIGIPSNGTSHRHYSHLFMLYPYHMISWENPTENALLTTSLSKWNGNQGYSHTGKAAMLASKGDGDGALSQMTTFFNTYIKPNTLYAETGPVIETPLAAVSTLHEFYMQDWGDRIRVFFGTPSSWDNASFINMRAKGAFLVSATRKNGKTVFIQIESEKGGLCRIQTGMLGLNIQVVGLDGLEHPFILTNAANGTIEINTEAGDVFQIIDKASEVTLPEAIEHPLNETMFYGVNNGPDIPLESLSFENDIITLTEEMPSKFLIVTAEPDYLSVGKLTWTSSNPSVVRVQNGLIQAISVGSSILKAENMDGISAECTVIVEGDRFLSYASIPEADTYAYDGSSAKNSNYGDEQTIVVKYDGTGYNRIGFFKFSIGDMDKYLSVDDSISVEASVYVNSTGSTTANTSWQFFTVPVTTWMEMDLTWNNKPSVSSTLLYEEIGKNYVSEVYSAANRICFDITIYAWEEYRKGETTISFNATQKSIVPGGAHSSFFASKENIDIRKMPYIVVKWVKKQHHTDLLEPNKAGINVYPTITDNFLYVSSSLPTSYCLTDIQGRKLFSGKVFASEENIVDLSFCAKGIYLLRIGESTYKIIRR